MDTPVWVRELLLASFIACVFTLWQIVGKRLGVPGGWLSLIIMLSSMVAAGGISYKTGALNLTSLLALGTYTLCAVAVLGVLNGIGFQLYSQTVSVSERPSDFVKIVLVLMVVLATVFDRFINDVEITIKHVAAMVLFGTGIYLMKS